MKSKSSETKPNESDERFQNFYTASSSPHSQTGVLPIFGLFCCQCSFDKLLTRVCVLRVTVAKLPVLKFIEFHLAALYPFDQVQLIFIPNIQESNQLKGLSGSRTNAVPYAACMYWPTRWAKSIRSATDEKSLLNANPPRVKSGNICALAKYMTRRTYYQLLHRPPPFVPECSIFPFSSFPNFITVACHGYAHCMACHCPRIKKLLVTEKQVTRKDHAAHD